MGLLDLFVKRDHTHFERDETGRVIRVIRNGKDVTNEPKWKSTEQLLKEYYKKHPKKSILDKLASAGKAIDKVLSNMQPITLPKEYDLFGTTPPPSKTRRPKKRYVIRDGVAYPVATRKKRSSKGKKKSTSEFDPFDNWGLL